MPVAKVRKGIRAESFSLSCWVDVAVEVPVAVAVAVGSDVGIEVSVDEGSSGTPGEILMPEEAVDEAVGLSVGEEEEEEEDGRRLNPPRATTQLRTSRTTRARVKTAIRALSRSAVFLFFFSLFLMLMVTGFTGRVCLSEPDSAVFLSRPEMEVTVESLIPAVLLVVLTVVLTVEALVLELELLARAKGGSRRCCNSRE